MALTKDNEVREVGGITEAERQRILDFLQGTVYSWCKNRKGEWFSVRDLMGGDNYFWSGTPLQVLYSKYHGRTDNPVSDAGKDAGWLLKKVIAEDKREFDTKVEARTRQYKWVGGEEDT